MQRPSGTYISMHSGTLSSRLKSAARMQRIINIETVSLIIYILLSHQYLTKHPQQQMLEVMVLNVL